MNPIKSTLYQQLERDSSQWATLGLPSRRKLEARAAELSDWKQRHGICGLWPEKPLMLTATLDDGMGIGIDMIHRYADVLGLEVIPLGLLVHPRAIISACQKHTPHFLGLTVLQLDSDDDLACVGSNLPPETLLIAGGPVFRYDTNMAERCGVNFVARDVGRFIAFMLDLFNNQCLDPCDYTGEPAQ